MESQGFTETRKVGSEKDQQSAGGSQGRPEGSSGHKRDRGLGVTLFIENIPRRMHWKALWHMFARHGERGEWASATKEQSAVEKQKPAGELGFKDDTVDPLSRSTSVKAPVQSALSHSEESSESFSEEEQKGISEKELRKGDVEGESFNKMGAGKVVEGCSKQYFENLNSHQGKWEGAGGESSGKSPKFNGENDNRTGITHQTTSVKGLSQKVGQECPLGKDRDGEKEVGLSTKEGVEALVDWENETFQMEAQGDVDTLSSFSERDSEF
ncbi:hypothetical protein V6N12_061384 [Hibiscus sabdariffa]|uniref:Uncharacterized protein n=1 Tax=Hibiscus sabdariffa TaxID=183260 RepID=A0ABR2DWY9_9ROSI